MVLTCEPDLATTTCDFFGWVGVRFGLLKPDTPALLSLGSVAILFILSNFAEYGLDSSIFTETNYHSTFNLYWIKRMFSL
jgi:hypothetical protein